jgi:hypothetical protein
VCSCVCVWCAKIVLGGLLLGGRFLKQGMFAVLVDRGDASPRQASGCLCGAVARVLGSRDSFPMHTSGGVTVATPLVGSWKKERTQRREGALAHAGQGCGS